MNNRFWFDLDYQKHTIDFRINFKYQESLPAAKYTIERIMLDYPAPYRLMASGGVDSQAMLYAWMLYGRNFIPTSIRYNSDMNSHDLETLGEFTKLFNLDVEYVDFDVLNFYQTSLPELAEKYKCISPQFATHIAMTTGLNGTCIFSGDLSFSGTFAVNSANLCVLRASQDRPIVPYFFIHTPELAYSGHYTTRKKKLLLDNYHRHDFYKIKCDIYHKLGYPVIPQTEKYTGFERIKEYFDIEFKHLVTPAIKLKYFNKPSSRIYDLLLRYPYEEKYGTCDMTIFMNDLSGVSA